MPQEVVTMSLDPQREAPVYNIKAVSRLTGVPADTLRRWESRYNMLTPQRTESGYRLYSQRDVDTIQWLKARLDEGLSISRAFEMLRQLGGDPGRPTYAPSPPSLLPVSPVAEEPSRQMRSFQALRQELMDAFRNVDETRAGGVVADALNLYPVEEVCLQLMQPIMVAVGQAWLDGEISVAVEHFASSFIRSRLSNLFHTSPYNTYGPLVLVGCAPEELHELGAMFLAIFLRRSGYRVVYLGQNVPLESMEGMITALQPDAVCVSASRAESASSLYHLHDFIQELAQHHRHVPLLAYGGQVFNRYPHIVERLGGLFLGTDARSAVESLNERLQKREI